MMHWFDAIQAGRRATLRALLKGRFGSWGEGCSYDPVTSRITGYERIHLGRDVFIGPYAIISAYEPVLIGDDTKIGPMLLVITGNHRFRDSGKTYSELTVGDNEGVTIGRNVWIGARVTILKGVTVGDGAVVGAGAVLADDVPSFTVVAGVPARVIGQRFDEPERSRHEELVSRLHQPSAPRP